jgi:hypothetical protein
MGQRLSTNVIEFNYDESKVILLLMSCANLASATAAEMMLAVGREDLAYAMHKAFDYCFPSSTCETENPSVPP